MILLFCLQLYKFVDECSNVETKKRKKKSGKHTEMKKRKLTEEYVAVREDHTTGYWLWLITLRLSTVVTVSFNIVLC